MLLESDKSQNRTEQNTTVAPTATHWRRATELAGALDRLWRGSISRPFFDRVGGCAASARPLISALVCQLSWLPSRVVDFFAGHTIIHEWRPHTTAMALVCKWDGRWSARLSSHSRTRHAKTRRILPFTLTGTQPHRYSPRYVAVQSTRFHDLVEPALHTKVLPIKTVNVANSVD